MGLVVSLRECFFLQVSISSLVIAGAFPVVIIPQIRVAKSDVLLSCPIRVSEAGLEVSVAFILLPVIQIGHLRA